MAQRHAEIAGAGFAGLTVGAALAQRGWSVRVHERAPECREFGAGIWTWENGVRVLNAVGAANEAFEGALRIPSWESRDGSGRIIDFFPMGDHETGGRLFCVTRQHLYEAILATAERSGVEIETSSNAIGATPEGELQLENGKRCRADLVIGADGINSNVRESTGLLRRKRRHGTGCIRVIVDRKKEEGEDPEQNRIIEYWSGNRRVLFTPCSKEVLYLALTSLASDREAMHMPVPRDVWKRSFPHVAEFFDRIPEEARWDRFETIWTSSWSKGCVALLGDAAHGMTPGLGQGCGMAMVNALGLATALDEEPTIEQALIAWERRERPLTEHTQFWSWTTWPMTRVPAPVARSIFNCPGLRQWIATKRGRPSIYIPHGTEGQPRWLPKAMREEQPATQAAS